MSDEDIGGDKPDETGISWTATYEKPLLIEHAGRAFRCWPEHHESSGTVQWLVEVDGRTELLGLESGPDDTEEDVRRQVERYWTAKRSR